MCSHLQGLFKVAPEQVGRVPGLSLFIVLCVCHEIVLSLGGIPSPDTAAEGPHFFPTDFISLCADV